MASLPLQLHERRAALVSATAREPRKVPATLVTGTVTVSESCEYYGVADAVSRCRVPRSCQDCLAMPGCGLTDFGSCKNLTSEAGEFTRSPDYRTTTFSVDSLVSNTSSFVFTADSASYCAASDPVCTKCREQFKANAVNKTSEMPTMTQFCKGADGCVCIAICEVPRRWASRTIDWQCGQPDINIFPFPAITRSNQTTGRSDPRAPAIVLKRPPKDEESCEYTKEVDLRGCRRPRTCQSCLEAPNCAIVYSRCYGINQYSWFYDFRKATLDSNNRSAVSNWQFPSTNTSYCPASDTTCAACRQSFRKADDVDWNYLLNNGNSFCVGQDGCVCIESCESDLWATEVDDTECNRVGESTVGISALVGAVVAVITWISLYKCCFSEQSRARRRRRRTNGAEQPMWRNMLDELPAIGRLDLFGWRAHQEELYFREQQLLHGLEITPVRPPVDFDSMDPSAPDFDEDESSAPTAQDPKALASAPVYRSSFHDNDSTSEGTSSSSNQDTDHSSPSAPDFDEEVAEWERRGRESERVGLVTRRPWRGE